MKKIFQNKNFLFLFFGQFISVLGDRISTAVFISLSVIIIGSTQSSIHSSLLLATQLAPVFLFGYFFGLLADNFKKKFIMLLADFLRILIIIIILLFQNSLILLYFVVFMIGTLTSLFEPAKKAMIPFIVSSKNLEFLNKIYATMEIIAMMIELGVGAFLLEVISIDKALMINISTYTFSFILIYMIKYKDNINIKKKEKSSYSKKLTLAIHELNEGINYLKRNENLKSILFNLIFFHFFASGFFFSVGNDFGVRTSEGIGLFAGSNVSLVLFIVAFGAMFGIAGKNLLKKYKDSHLTMYLFLAGSIVFTLLGLSSYFLESHYFINLFLFGIIGLIAGIQYVRYLYLIHLNCNKKFMGRIIAIVDLVMAISIISGVILGAFLSELITYKIAFFFIALEYFIAFLLLFKKYKTLDW